MWCDEEQCIIAVWSVGHCNTMTCNAVLYSVGECSMCKVGEIGFLIEFFLPFYVTLNSILSTILTNFNQCIFRRMGKENFRIILYSFLRMPIWIGEKD